MDKIINDNNIIYNIYLCYCSFILHTFYTNYIFNNFYIYYDAKLKGNINFFYLA